MVLNWISLYFFFFNKRSLFTRPGFDTKQILDFLSFPHIPENELDFCLNLLRKILQKLFKRSEFWYIFVSWASLLPIIILPVKVLKDSTIQFWLHFIMRLPFTTLTPALKCHLYIFYSYFKNSNYIKYARITYNIEPVEIAYLNIYLYLYIRYLGLILSTSRIKKKVGWAYNQTNEVL